ncbi:hypothetical protein ACFPT7_07685 [Acidicapsa dinghuensis]|uniref:Septum formation inhibitor-activating ATPase n=1 Tax=Acidicapsa dinghuensis TaxID=2218256 RepID=A0ABW1EDX2_9BACT|nr:hypothetical protein [Acidicapsa dinghuensis]
MPQPTLVDLIENAAGSNEPRSAAELKIATGGVDPLGLRQINFQLMDLVLPGLNNVARHIRPYTVIAWAWRRAAHCARATGRAVIPDTEIVDFVDRVEVLFTWSQLLRDAGADLPGRDFLSHLKNRERFAFGGTAWKKMCTARRYSTALSAPVNYGPAVKFLGWIEPTDKRRIFKSSDRVQAALDAFEKGLRKDIHHPAFNRFGPVEVTQDEVLRWSDVWDLTDPTDEEKAAMRASLDGVEGNSALSRASRCIAEQVEFRKGKTGVAEIRSDLCGVPSAFLPSPELADLSAHWRNIQLRQLFRLSLEAILYWASAMTSERPYETSELVRAFLAKAGSARTASKWLHIDADDEVDIPELLETLQACLYQGPESGKLAVQIRRSLAVSLFEKCEDVVTQNRERLPLSRAREEMEALSSQSSSVFLEHVFNSWVFGQHVYWAIGRGLGDARSRGKTILRLRVVPDEGGWTLAPGANARSVPRATPDRLETAVCLMQEAGMIGAKSQ